MKLYVYDHCPYCVKARMIFGLKDLPYQMIFVLNDDVETPTRMIGKKMVPILEKDDGTYMPESMDIVHYVDRNYGERIVIGPSNPKISTWLEGVRSYLYRLAMPRWVQVPLGEFKTDAACNYFREKKEASIGSFAEHLAQTKTLIAEAERHLRELEPLVVTDAAVGGVLSDDDFHLFAALRSLSIVKGIRYPEKVEAYRKRMAEKSGIVLHDGIAL